MRITSFHRWDVTPREAIALQGRLRERISCRRSFDLIETVAGADIAFAGERAVAAVIVYRFSAPLCFGRGREPTGGGDLIEIERVHAEGKLSFPYVPGLLSFREGPLLLDAFAKLAHVPDVVLFDGQGVAHPRRFGLASHLGLWLNLPTVGCAKSRLFGEHAEPGRSVGEWAPLTLTLSPLGRGKRDRTLSPLGRGKRDRTLSPLGRGKRDRTLSPLGRGKRDRTLSPQGRGKGEGWSDVLGAVLRTRACVRPIYISIGHRIDLPSAIALAMACIDRTRIPKPTREADRLVGTLARGLLDEKLVRSGRRG